MLCVLIVLNIFTAFVLEAFAMEYSAVLKGDHSEQRLLDRIVGLYPISTSGSASCAVVSGRKKCDSNQSCDDVETGTAVNEGDHSLDRQLDADHEQMQWIQLRNGNDSGCASEGGNSPQRLQLLIRPKNSVETLLLKMFSSNPSV